MRALIRSAPNIKLKTGKSAFPWEKETADLLSSDPSFRIAWAAIERALERGYKELGSPPELERFLAPAALKKLHP